MKLSEMKVKKETRLHSPGFADYKPKEEIIRPLPTKIVKELPEEILDKIAFQKIANSSEFKRLVYLIWFGKTHRGKSNDLERQLIKRKEEIIVINKIGRGTHQDFREVVSELKEALAKRKAKIEDQE